VVSFRVPLLGRSFYVINAADVYMHSLMKYADDTYLVIRPACNVDSRDKEIAIIDASARVNDVKCIEVG